MVIGNFHLQFTIHQLPFTSYHSPVTILRFFPLISWPILPSSVQPPVLTWVFPHEFLNCSGIFCGNPFQRVILLGPFFGEDNAIDSNFKVKTITLSPAVSDSYRYIVGNGHQAYAFISAGLTTEEINK
jgi:hypothetical protein